MSVVDGWVGRSIDAGFGDVAVERGHILHWCEAVEDANPLYWDEQIAEELTGGWIAPPSMLSVWMRPLAFKPDRGPGPPDPRPGEDAGIRPLEIHFQLKDALGLPEGIVAGNEIVFGEPLRPGDTVATTQTVRSIGEERTNRLGTGRDWTIDVTYTNQNGAVVGIETYHMFGYNRPAGT